MDIARWAKLVTLDEGFARSLPIHAVFHSARMTPSIRIYKALMVGMKKWIKASPIIVKFGLFLKY